MKSRRRSGTQSIERTVLLLKELAARGEFGWRLLDLSAQCGLDRGTTHRLLACLIRERLVQQDPDNRRYFPGPLLFELGLSLPAHARFLAACSPPLNRIAKRLGGTALLYLRSGNEFVCAARVGSAPIKALTIDVGTRRPLVQSVGGVAMLIAMPRDEARAVIAQNMRRAARFGPSRVRSLERVIRHSESRGYAISQSEIVPGVSAYGVAVCDASQAPFGSVSVVGSAESFPSSRVPAVIETLRQEAGAVARQAAQHLGPTGGRPHIPTGFDLATLGVVSATLDF
jgi:DNA-binding IclR family transcriptional regulator